jgi:hypothetical protein
MVLSAGRLVPVASYYQQIAVADRPKLWTASDVVRPASDDCRPRYSLPSCSSALHTAAGIESSEIGRPTEFTVDPLQFCRQSRPTQPGTSREPRPSANAHLSAGTTPQRLFGAFSTRRSYLQTSVPRKRDGDEIIVAVTARQREIPLKLLQSSFGADHREEPSQNYFSPVVHRRAEV